MVNARFMSLICPHAASTQSDIAVVTVSPWQHTIVLQNRVNMQALLQALQQAAMYLGLPSETQGCERCLGRHAKTQSKAPQGVCHAFAPIARNV